MGVTLHVKASSIGAHRYRAAIFAALAACATTACARPSGGTQPPAGRATWVDRPLLGDVDGDLEDLQRLGQGDAGARLVRLDRLIDLLDAARFGEDEYARETLWGALGGHPTGIGADATRDAMARLLQEALAVESTAAPEGAGLQEPAAALLADAIMMLSVDLERPESADALSIATAAYRQLASSGHPRIADNARWRLYDHVRGTLEGAVGAPPGERADVAVQALYVERESLEDHLRDTGPASAPARPTPDALWHLLEREVEALAADPRWAPVVTARHDRDDALRDTVRSVLPAPRDPQWPAPHQPANTAQPESLAPVVVAQGGLARIDAGRPQARSVRLESGADAQGDPARDLERAFSGALAQDGRGTLLLALDPELPAPQLHTLLRGIRRAQTSRIELAVRQGGADGEILAGLPLVVIRSADRTSGGAAILAARISAHLHGRGVEFAVDGHPLTATPAGATQLAALIETLSRAYPRERIVRLTLGSDVSVRQLVELVAALEGGPAPKFTAVGWWAGGNPTPGDAKPAHDAVVERRAALSFDASAVRLEQPYPLKAADQTRLETFAATIGQCTPELQTKSRGGQIEVEFRFEDGKLAQVQPGKTRASKQNVAAFRSCVEEAGFGVRLRNHRDRVDFKVAFTIEKP